MVKRREKDTPHGINLGRVISVEDAHAEVIEAAQVASGIVCYERAPKNAPVTDPADLPAPTETPASK